MHGGQQVGQMLARPGLAQGCRVRQDGAVGPCRARRTARTFFPQTRPRPGFQERPEQRAHMEAVAEVDDQDAVVLDSLVQAGGSVPVEAGVDRRSDDAVPQVRLPSERLAEEAAKPAFVDGDNEPGITVARDEVLADAAPEILLRYFGRILDDGPLPDRGHGAQGGGEAERRCQPGTECRLAVASVPGQEDDSRGHLSLPEGLKQTVQSAGHMQGIRAREPTPASTKRVEENLARLVDVTRVTL